MANTQVDKPYSVDINYPVNCSGSSNLVRIDGTSHIYCCSSLISTSLCFTILSFFVALSFVLSVYSIIHCTSYTHDTSLSSSVPWKTLPFRSVQTPSAAPSDSPSPVPSSASLTNPTPRTTENPTNILTQPSRMPTSINPTYPTLYPTDVPSSSPTDASQSPSKNPSMVLPNIAPASSSYVCESYGAFLSCSTGVVIGECGSGYEAQCTESSKNFCSALNEDTYHPRYPSSYWGNFICEGIACNYPSLNTSRNTSSWICGQYGTELSCKDYGGSALVGVCGSGSEEDCLYYCRGSHAILCAEQDYININWNRCTWQKAAEGEWVYCPTGYIATGHCGSASSPSCGAESQKMNHELQCCEFIYEGL
eukprot:428185_1